MRIFHAYRDMALSLFLVLWICSDEVNGDPMREDPKTGRYTASFEEMALYNMVLVEALSELLVENGTLDRAEILERVEKIKKEVSIKKHSPQ
jgi:hypothetical protein